MTPQNGGQHDIVPHGEGFVKCKRCGKMATAGAERKLQQTACNPDSNSR